MGERGRLRGGIGKMRLHMGIGGEVKTERGIGKMRDMWAVGERRRQRGNR